MYGAWTLWYLTAAVRAGMVELVDAPDSKSGGLRPLGVRVPLPALGIAPEDHIRIRDFSLGPPRRSESGLGTFSPPRRLEEKTAHLLRLMFELYVECRSTRTACHL